MAADVYRVTPVPEPGSPRIAWSPESSDLHVNVVVLKPGESIGEHVNASLDVVMTCLAGEGTLTVDGEDIAFSPGTVALVPTGAIRGVVAGNNGVQYTTCHRKRGGIMPTVQSRS